jgi:hypothetical protein
MPSEHEARTQYSVVDMARSELVDGQLVFDEASGFDRALSQGFFLLRIPSKVDVTPGDRFAERFFEAKRGDELDLYRGFRDVKVKGDYQGYFDREHDQWENYYIEMDNWGVLPAGVAALGCIMTDIGIAVLRNVLDYVGVPKADWELVTSGLSEKKGHQMLAFNHFRSEKKVRGTKFHRDSGWVTVLRSTEPGLVGLIEDRLSSINPEPGYFILNFGSSIEVLTQKLRRPVRANVHGVARTERRAGQPDRTSYVVFLDSNLSGSIYEYDEREGPRRLQSLAEFAQQEVSRTYDDDNTHL